MCHVYSWHWCIAGVNSKNVAYIANAIHDCVTTVKA